MEDKIRANMGEIVPTYDDLNVQSDSCMCAQMTLTLY